MASARSFPVGKCGRMFDDVENATSIWFASIAMMVSLAPLNGTWVNSTPVRTAKYSIIKRWILAGPVEPKLIAPGLDFASATNSEMDFAGTWVATASIADDVATSETGVSSDTE